MSIFRPHFVTTLWRTLFPLCLSSSPQTTLYFKIIILPNRIFKFSHKIFLKIDKKIMEYFALANGEAQCIAFSVPDALAELFYHFFAT